MASPFSLSSLSSSPLSPYYHLFFTLLAFLISGLIFLLTQKTKSKRSNLPPGPPGWPIVGNLFQVVRSGKPFFEYVRDLRTQYGPILTLKMGTRTLIILSDPKLVHEALIENGAVFASRPRENPTRNIFSCNKFTVNAAVYGPVWRSLRKNMVQNMLSSSRLREFRGARARAMDRFIERLRAEAKAGDGVVWVLRNARFAVFCILVTMCFGIEMDEGTVERMDQVMKSVLITLDPRIDDFLPVLSPFFSRQQKEALRVRAEQVEFVSRFIQQRRRALASPGSDDSATSFSYLDTLFDLRIEGRDNSPPSREELVTLCSEFLNGGTDTTGTAVEWGIAQLIANPTVQDRIYDEIRSIVGGDGGGRKIDEKDVEKMPYLEAVVKELLRKHPPTPFSLTHAVTEPTTLAGYDIPTDANVEIFVSGISDDPKIWTDPERFDPTRFLAGGEGEQVQGGGGGIKMMPFGVGRRICPGLNMATVHIHLNMISIVVSLCLFYVLAATVAHVGLPHPPQAAVLTISSTPSYAGITYQISLFAGFLAAVLQLTILVPLFGWLTFALWALFFVKFAFHLLCINLFPRLLSLLLYMWIKATRGERVVAQNRLRRRPPV